MRLRAGASSDVGRLRERNEDSFVVKDPLFAVADGLGGHLGGEVASRLAVDTLTSEAGADGPEDGLADRLRAAVHQANSAVAERAANDTRLTGMGTTLTALVAGRDRIYLAHVGDSRAYLLRDGDLRLLTEDHTLVHKMLLEGEINEQEAETHPHRSILTRALGVDGNVQVDEGVVEMILLVEHLRDPQVRLGRVERGQPAALGGEAQAISVGA